MDRNPAVAGQFYTNDEKKLRSQVQEFLQKGSGEQIECKGIIAPHAGYMYSGQVAGAVYGSIKIPDKVIVLAPKHNPIPSHDFAIWDEGKWNTPLGQISVNNILAEKILAINSSVGVNTEVHVYEHSLEVQLPFIQEVNQNAEIIPILVSTYDYEQLSSFGEKLGNLLLEEESDTLIVASSDMNHQEPDEVTRKKDSMAIDKIEKYDPKGLFNVCRENDITMCGLAPSVVMLNACKILGATEAKLIKYSTSADTGGLKDRTVGYAGVIVK